MAAVWFTRAIRKIVKVSLEEKGMVVVMKKENRAGRFCVAVLLAALLTTQAVPLQVFAWERQEGTVSVENEYLKVTVNRANGGYAITTREGDIPGWVNLNPARVRGEVLLKYPSMEGAVAITP